MHIKILGRGCHNCRRLGTNVEAALARAGVAASVEKVEDDASIVAYGVSATPALVVDERVVHSGRVPSPGQIARLLGIG